MVWVERRVLLHIVSPIHQNMFVISNAGETSMWIKSTTVETNALVDPSTTSFLFLQDTLRALVGLIYFIFDRFCLVIEGEKKGRENRSSVV
jgi:hypothetical protein